MKNHYVHCFFFICYIIVCSRIILIKLFFMLLINNSIYIISTTCIKEEEEVVISNIKTKFIIIYLYKYKHCFFACECNMWNIICACCIYYFVPCLLFTHFLHTQCHISFVFLLICVLLVFFCFKFTFSWVD
jgi:hypothetical protein